MADEKSPSKKPESEQVELTDLDAGDVKGGFEQALETYHQDKVLQRGTRPGLRQ